MTRGSCRLKNGVQGSICVQKGFEKGFQGVRKRFNIEFQVCRNGVYHVSQRFEQVKKGYHSFIKVYQCFNVVLLVHTCLQRF